MYLYSVLDEKRKTKALSLRKPVHVVLTLGLLWVCLVGFGVARLWRYSITPGHTISLPSQWPAGSLLHCQPGAQTLVLFAHPHCPCTRATLSELARIMAHRQGPLFAYILFYKPGKTPENWEKTDLYYRAAGIPGVRVVTDTAGAEARRFHATTSGQTFLFDIREQLLFDGGITAARGHEGDNAGQQALSAMLIHPHRVKIHTPVFGCSLSSNTDP